MRDLNRSATTLILCAVLFAAVLAAQTAKPAFMVASVKPSAPGNDGRPRRIDVLTGGVLRGSNVTLEQLLQFAYRRPTWDLRPDLIVDPPAWARQDHFDVEAQAGDGATADQIALMLQRLLEDRFRLVAGIESRDRDVYLLRRKRSDALGPDLRSNTTAACANARAGGERVPFLPSAAPSTAGRLWFGRPCATSEELARNVASMLKTDVVDETGLMGAWDYMATYPEDTAGPQAGATSLNNDLSLLPIALERNLGLTLVKQRRAVPVLVVKSVQRPAAN